MGGQGGNAPKILKAYPVILCFGRQCPERKTVARLNPKYMPPKNFGLGYVAACNHFHGDGLHLSRAQPCSSVPSLSHSTFLIDVQSSTDKRLATTQDRETVAHTENFNGGIHSVAYGGHLYLVCAVCNVTLLRHIHVSQPTFWRSLLT